MTQEIRRHVQEMRGAVDDFTLLSEWTIGQMPGYRQKIDLHQVLDTVVAQLSALVLEREQLLRVQPSAGKIEITGDRLALGLLLTALLVTGMKSAPQNSEVMVSAAQDGSQAVVTVQCADCDEGARIVPYESGLSTTVVRSLAEGIGGRFEMSPVSSAREWRCDLWLPNVS
jgi:light-regulated signal transduction histidine kinase (bacteriophytochrome)